MRVGVFSGCGAQNSAPVFDAWCQGAQRLGWQCNHHDLTADVAVIWSMLWRGRMRDNRAVWQHYRGTGRPVIVLEVGSLRRGVTWRMGINGVTATATWCDAIDPHRPQRLGLTLEPWRTRGSHVLIACQRGDSEQWQAQPAPEIWLRDTVQVLQRHTQRPIRVRPHPRFRQAVPAGVQASKPRSVVGTYDGFDFDRDLAGAWAVVNWSSGPGPQAIMAGVPAFVGPDSLAAPVGNFDLSLIESPETPDRCQWLINISHTEWTVDELATGQPQQILAQRLN